MSRVDIEHHTWRQRGDEWFRDDGIKVALHKDGLHVEGFSFVEYADPLHIPSRVLLLLCEPPPPRAATERGRHDKQTPDE